MLVSAQVTYGMMQRLSVCPYYDFSSVLNLCSKALEEEIRQRVFVPFRSSPYSKALPLVESHPPAVRKSKDFLERFCEDRGCLSLGQMAGCLSNLGCQISEDQENGFAQFLDKVLLDREKFCGEDKIPDRLRRFVRSFRNPSVHGEIVTFEMWNEARKFLFEKPEDFLQQLVDSFREKTSEEDSSTDSERQGR